MKPFSISIPEPCSENWEQMTPCERGRFCGSCQKTVIDFTDWNDAALYGFFSQEVNRNVCGRFYKHQIENKVFSYTAPLKRPSRTLAMAASVAALTVISATVANAQTQKGGQHTSVSASRKNAKQKAKKPINSLTEVVVKREKFVKPLIVPTQPAQGVILLDKEIEKMPVRDRETCSDSIQSNNFRRGAFQRIGDWFKKHF